MMACINLSNGGIACTRGKRIKPEALKRDLEIIAQFERDLKDGKYDKRRKEG